MHHCNYGIPSGQHVYLQSCRGGGKITTEFFMNLVRPLVRNYYLNDVLFFSYVGEQLTT